MRITNQMLVNSMINNVFVNQARMDKLQKQMATGKKITEASDDPVVASRSLKLRTDLAEIVQYQRNTSDAGSWMESSETALTNITEVLHRVRELSVQASNGILKSEDTKKIGKEIQQLKSQLVHLGNSSYAGRYIFSGFETSQKLMVDDESSPDFGAFNVTIDSQKEKILYEIGIGDSININSCGGDLFNSSSQNIGKAITMGNTPMTFPATITTGTNDVISLNIDEAETVVATLPPGTYDDIGAVEVALENAINTTSVTSADIQVTSIGGRLQFISGTSGASSKIDIDSDPLVTTALFVLGVDTVTNFKADGNAVGNKNGISRGDFPIAFPLNISAASNDILSLDIDGVETVAITIPSNIYADIDSLALAIQLEINNSSGLAQDISVTGLGNRLQFKSGTIGENSSIVIDSDPLISTSAIDLGLGTTTTEKGSTATKSKLMVDMDLLIDAFEKGEVRTISDLLGNIDDDLQNVIKVRADMGARYNRIELTRNRLMGDDVTFTKLMSENEDIDMAEVIMNLTSEENVYKASLSAGARIIQPTLLDFLR